MHNKVMIVVGLMMAGIASTCEAYFVLRNMSPNYTVAISFARVWGKSSRWYVLKPGQQADGHEGYTFDRVTARYDISDGKETNPANWAPIAQKRGHWMINQTITVYGPVETPDSKVKMHLSITTPSGTWDYAEGDVWQK